MEIEEANKSLWEVRDWLDSNLGLKDLKAALDANGSASHCPRHLLHPALFLEPSPLLHSPVSDIPLVP